MNRFVLVSHALCPYVQRAAIVLMEKGVSFERRDISLADKPAWLSEVSPLGKTPVLLVDDQPIFESAVICEYLEEILAPRLHPANPLQRARHRAWIEFSSSILSNIWHFYTAKSKAGMQVKIEEMQNQFAQLENILSRGPYFAGTGFSMVDACFGPIFRYFDVFDEIQDFGVFARTPKVQAWRLHLAKHTSVHSAVQADYAQRLILYIRECGSELAKRLDATGTGESGSSREVQARQVTPDNQNPI